MNDSYANLQLICSDCGSPFAFTAGEQRFYAEKGLTRKPSRCKPCRDARLRHAGVHRPPAPASANGAAAPTMRPPVTVATCSSCGREARLPFAPDPSRPVYCRPCLKARR